MLTTYTSGSADGSGYNITIDFVGSDWTDELQEAFTKAADYLSTIITGDVSDQTRNFFDGKGTRTIDDLEISAELRPIDGNGGVLGFAGPDFVRPVDFFPITGTMVFDTADVAPMLANDQANGTDGYDDLVLHEMLHAVGFGTTWENSGLVVNQGSSIVTDYRFTGTQARKEYEILFPTKFQNDPGSDQGVAVENDGGEGTAGGHWDEEIFTTELMTGFLDAGAELSNLSIAALDDMGYETTYVASEVVCFAKGTKLTTDLCQMAVEDLSVGDMVETLDNGLQEIRWIGSRKLDAVDLKLHKHLEPIKLSAGCLGFGTPHRDLYVSPQHRILVSSKIAQKMFGTSEILVAAKDLLSLDGVETVEATDIEYFHVLFDDHQVVFSNGAATESLFTGERALKSLPPKAVTEIFELFPELRDQDGVPQSARPLIDRGSDVNKLLNRHIKSNLPLINEAYS